MSLLVVLLGISGVGPVVAATEILDAWAWTSISASSASTAWGVRLVIKDDESGVLLRTELLVETAIGNRLRAINYYDPEIGGYVSTLQDLESGWKASYRVGIARPKALLPLTEDRWYDVYMKVFYDKEMDGEIFTEFSASNGVQSRLMQGFSAEPPKRSEADMVLDGLAAFVDDLPSTPQEGDFPASLVDEVRLLIALGMESRKDFALLFVPLAVSARAQELLARAAAAAFEPMPTDWKWGAMEDYFPGVKKEAATQWLVKRFEGAGNSE